jgi:hypothetical protein
LHCFLQERPVVIHERSYSSKSCGSGEMRTRVHAGSLLIGER